jgi:hypothetical protein
MQRVENTDAIPASGDRHYPPGSSLDEHGRVTPRWRGKRPVTWSRQRRQELRAVSRFKSHRAELEAQRERAMSGSRLVELRNHGKARPFGQVLTHKPEVCRRVLPSTPRAKELGHDRLSHRDLLALAWLAATHIGFRSSGLAIAWKGWAELLECCSKTAGTTVRRLVAMGLVISDPFHVPVPGGMARRENSFRLAPEILAFFRDLNPPGKGCEAETTESSLRSDNKVSPVGDDGRAPEGDGFPAPTDRPASGVRKGLERLATRFVEQTERRLVRTERDLRFEAACAAARSHPRRELPPDEVSPLVAAVALALDCTPAEAAGAIELARDHGRRCVCAVCWTGGRV